MICNGCGQEILSGAIFCPVCGTSTGHTAGSSSRKKIDADKILDNAADSGHPRHTHHDSGGQVDEYTDLLVPGGKRRYNKLPLYSGIGFFVFGVVSFLLLNPLPTSGFSIWDQNAYMRGMPLYICVSLPYAMAACDLLIIAAGILGAILSGKQGARLFYKISGVLAAFASSGSLALRIVHEHVIIRSPARSADGVLLSGSIVRLNDNYPQDMYILFIFAAITAALSFCYIYYSSSAPGKYLPRSSGTLMIVIGLIGFACGISGVVFGSGAGEGVPRAAVWASIAFGTMFATGIAGISKRRKSAARAAWRLIHLIVFTLCTLQAIFYSYSAIVKGTFFRNGPFIWIAALSCVLAASTVMSAHYICQEPAKSAAATKSLLL